MTDTCSCSGGRMVCKEGTWEELQKYYNEEGNKLDLRKLFFTDANRFEKYSIKISEIDMLIDYSKNLISDEALELLLKLARNCKVEGRREAMFQGEHVNITEDRAVLHTALRAPPTAVICDNGVNVVPDVHHELGQMKTIAESIRSGEWKGVNGQAITDVVNIGIGGSDLGPMMVTEALKHYASDNVKVHFVSNIDGTHLAECLKKLNPSTTLFIIVSKTFTTAETMTNAESAKQWFLQSHSQTEVHRHFVAVSTNTAAVTAFGIKETNMIKFWDWVGGRYSLWSAVGLSIMISIGFDRFEELLNGAHLMDQHFRHAPLHQNAPVLLALIGIWYNNFYGAQSQAILPYEQYLHRFPAYLQQGDMESNGKSATLEGKMINGKYQTGPIIWGEPGTNGQHAFYQLIHQGTKFIPIDFIVACRSLNPINGNIHHKMLLANCLAQSEALMKGRDEESLQKELAKETNEHRREMLKSHKSFSGNHPSTTIIYDTLTPRVLGALIALYEHKIFVQGVIWNINSFDQWGVELGKQLATFIQKEIESGKVSSTCHDQSTTSLLNYVLNRI